MVASSGMTGDPKARPWNAQARKYLKGLLLAAHTLDVGDGDKVGVVEQWTQWIYAGEKACAQVKDLLRSAGHSAPAREYASTWRIHEEGKRSVLFTALGLADTYSRPGVIAAVETGGFTPADLFDRHGILCIVTPNAEGDRFAAYFTTLVSAVLHEAETRAAQRSGPLEPRLLLALDEAGKRVPLPPPPPAIDHRPRQRHPAAAGLPRPCPGRAPLRRPSGRPHRGIERQDADAAPGRRGPRDPAVLVRPDGADPHAGPRHHHRQRRPPQPHLQRARRPARPLHRLQQLPDGHAVLLYQNLPPARVRLLPWYADKRFRHLAKPAHGKDSSS